MHHICTHIFLEIDLVCQNIKILELLSYKHNDKK